MMHGNEAGFQDPFPNPESTRYGVVVNQHAVLKLK